MGGVNPFAARMPPPSRQASTGAAEEPHAPAAEEPAAQVAKQDGPLHEPEEAEQDGK
jgi:hypothetical protein